MSRIKSVSEILNLTNSHSTPDKLARKYIVKSVDKLIRSRASDQQYSVNFEIPAIIVFQPKYDRNILTRAIVKHYRNIGFVCKVDGYNVMISWGDDSESDEEIDHVADVVELSPAKESEPDNNDYAVMSDVSSDDETGTMQFKVGNDKEKSLSERLAEMKKPSGKKKKKS